MTVSLVKVGKASSRQSQQAIASSRGEKPADLPVLAKAPPAEPAAAPGPGRTLAEWASACNEAQSEQRAASTAVAPPRSRQATVLQRESDGVAPLTET